MKICCIATFLVTSRQDAASIIAQQKKCRTNTIQLCDRIEVQALPGIALVQVVHVTGKESIDAAEFAQRENWME